MSARLLACVVTVVLMVTSGRASTGDPPVVDPAPAAQVSATYTERETGVRFDRRLVPPGSETEQLIAGAGVRTKFWFDVYAVALHVDPLAAWDELVDWRRKGESALEDDDDFFADLLSDDVPKTLSLVMVRDVDAEDMRAAFEDALKPRVQATRSHADRAAGLTALDTFEGFFDREYVEGTEMVLAARPGGLLTVTVDGRSKGTITSTALVRALFDVYLGEDPISSDARDAFGRGMVKVFARGEELAEEREQAEREAAESDEQGAEGRDDDGDEHAAAGDAEARRLTDERLARAEDQLRRNGQPGERLVDLLGQASGLIESIDALVDPLAEQARALHESARAFAGADDLAHWLGADDLPPPPCLCAFDTQAEWQGLRDWLGRVRMRLLDHARQAPLAG